MEGNVKFFNRKKGFGFITGEDGKDYFVHFSAVTPGVFLRDNDKVSFNTKEDERGLKAIDVQLLQKGSERTDLPPQEEEKTFQKEEEEEPKAEESDAEEGLEDEE